MILYEGVVTSVQDASFFATLHDLIREDVDQEAEFYISAVPEADREFIQVGAVFYWGVCASISLIKFRRELWTAEELDVAKEKAADLYSSWKRPLIRFNNRDA